MDTTRSLSTQHLHQQQQLHSLDTTGESSTTFSTSYTLPTMYSSTADEESSQTHSQAHSHPSTTTDSPSPSSTTTTTTDGFWSLPGQENEPSPQLKRETPLNGPSPSEVGRRPARRVQRCGVGPSRHGHSHSHSPGQGHGPYKATLMEIRCWDHGCEGRKFSSLGNYRRHLREKNGQAKVHPCPDCGRVFTRSTARNFHRESGTCGLSPRQLMLQMQMQMQMQMQIQTQTQVPLQNPPYPTFSVPSPMLYDSYVDWNSPMDLYSAPGVVLWGGTNGR